MSAQKPSGLKKPSVIPSRLSTSSLAGCAVGVGLVTDTSSQTYVHRTKRQPIVGIELGEALPLNQPFKAGGEHIGRSHGHILVAFPTITSAMSLAFASTQMDRLRGSISFSGFHQQVGVG